MGDWMILKRILIGIIIVFSLSGCISQEIQIGSGETVAPIQQTEVPTTSPPTVPQNTQIPVPTTISPLIQQSPCILGYQDDIPIISWKCADQYIGKEAIVEGVIVFTFNSSKVCEIDFYYDEIDEARKKASLATRKYFLERTGTNLEEYQKTFQELDKLLKEKKTYIASYWTSGLVVINIDLL
jgi:hypothetical protein